MSLKLSTDTLFLPVVKDMASLHKLLAYKPNTIYPGHGPLIEGQTSSIAKIEEYINHRNEREQQILSVLQEKTKAPSSSATAVTTREIVEVLYAGLGVGVFIAATKPVVAHLKKLEDDGKVVRDPDGKWRLL
ncbi:hypothetical protein QFC19_006824 [Naganishia cerealis]|uniref:Uncharacterized protein n=1 Tax=Naganishia cerealis TaxID=610337 RepID=A0ACC2VE56_9TREE|nr:hypothetical protein QFC19_006824 [Naganishia cerealis]